jgi:Ras-related protein Rab-2A
MEYDYLFKFLMLGDSGVGKSCLLINFIDKRFRPDHQINIGVEFGSVNVAAGSKTVKLQIWDTAGQEIFRSIIKSYYKNAAAVILVYDVTDRKSFTSLESWLGEIRQNANSKITIVLVGNKIDLEDARVVPKYEAQAFADSNELRYIETSAKTSENVETVFISLAQTICLRLDKELGQVSDDEDIDTDDVVLLNAEKISRPETAKRRRFFCCN